LVFYSLDPISGKGPELGKIQVSDTGPMFWALSPDGSQVALVDRVEYKGQIEVLTLSNRTWRPVAVEPGWGFLHSIAWAADGKSLFATSWLPGSSNLLHVSPAGKVTPLLRTRPWMFTPLPSPDGKYLAYGGWTVDSNVWILEGF